MLLESGDFRAQRLLKLLNRNLFLIGYAFKKRSPGVHLWSPRQHCLWGPQPPYPSRIPRSESCFSVSTKTPSMIYFILWAHMSNFEVINGTPSIKFFPAQDLLQCGLVFIVGGGSQDGVTDGSTIAFKETSMTPKVGDVLVTDLIPGVIHENEWWRGWRPFWPSLILSPLHCLARAFPADVGTYSTKTVPMLL